ncbi:MAG: spore photoproduct lyase family protein [Promethearchaeota archaeon]
MINKQIEDLNLNKITLGTKEWSDYSVNCINGCSNNCRYCYARKMAIRFGRKNNDNWVKMEIRQHNVEKKYRKRRGRFMFPTAHDITDDPKILDACIKVIKNIVEPSNSILITTKPRLNVIKKICNEFLDFKEFIQFRFTITSNNDKLLRFWEPGAPSFNERLNALKYAYNRGYKTSISIEPFLNKPSEFIEQFIPFITESIWVGPMNYIKCNGLYEKEKYYYNKIRKLTKPESLIKIYYKLKRYPLIRFKDSFLIKLKKSGFLI